MMGPVAPVIMETFPATMLMQELGLATAGAACRHGQRASVGLMHRIQPPDQAELIGDADAGGKDRA